MTAANTGRVSVIVQAGGSAPRAGDARFDLIVALLDKGYAVSCARSEVSTVTPAGGACVVLGHFGDQPPLSSTPAVRFQEMDGQDTEALVRSIDGGRET